MQLTAATAVLSLLALSTSHTAYAQRRQPQLPAHPSPNDKPLSTQYPSTDSSRFPRPLSRLAAKIYQRVTSEMLLDENYKNSPTPLDLIGTAGRVTQITSGNGSSSKFADNVIFPAITSARTEVLLTTFTLDRNTPSSDALSQALLELNERAGREGRRVRVCIVIDTVAATIFSHELPQIKSLFSAVTEISGRHYNLPTAKDLPHLDYRVKNMHRRLLGALHSKMILIDGHYTVMGSKNMDGDSSFEMMFTVQGALNQSMRSDFEHLWDEDLPVLPAGTFYPPRSGDVPIVVLSRVQSDNLLSSRVENPQNNGWLAALASAKRDVYIQTPNFTADLAAAAVLAAVRRGVEVTIVTAWKLGDREQKGYKHSVSHNRGTAAWMYRQLADEPTAAANLRVCWFISADRPEKDPKPTAADWSHVKFLSADGQIIITGSGNQDAQTWYRSRENNIMIDDVATTDWFMKDLLSKHQSLTHCYND